MDHHHHHQRHRHSSADRQMVGRLISLVIVWFWENGEHPPWCSWWQDQDQDQCSCHRTDLMGLLHDIGLHD